MLTLSFLKHRDLELCCDLESVLNIIKLLNKIEQEKCDLEFIVISNLRLRKCLSHNFVSKNRLIFVTFVCD